MANTTEHLESADSIRNQGGFPLSAAKIWMMLQLREQGGGPGIDLGTQPPVKVGPWSPRGACILILCFIPHPLPAPVWGGIRGVGLPH